MLKNTVSARLFISYLSNRLLEYPVTSSEMTHFLSRENLANVFPEQTTLKTVWTSIEDSEISAKNPDSFISK